MLKSKKFPVLQAMLCMLAVLCPLALTSCPGNGELDGTDNDTYTPGGRNSRGRGGGEFQ